MLETTKTGGAGGIGIEGEGGEVYDVVWEFGPFLVGFLSEGWKWNDDGIERLTIKMAFDT